MPGAQGGTYAAPVWHNFMLPAHGDYCDDFPQPTEPAQFSPFFGKYSATGRSSSQQYYNAPNTTTSPQYDPRYYEQAPLDQPNQTPQEQVEPAPTPGNGNGNGHQGGVSPN
jgi:membrane peptidoglycan carboxypeptidase